jgi:hypothetical protein
LDKQALILNFMIVLSALEAMFKAAKL